MAIKTLNQLQLTESQEKTYLLIKQGDRSAAQNYLNFCLNGAIPKREVKTNDPFRVCRHCSHKYYKNFKEAKSTFGKRKYCSSQCSALSQVKRGNIKFRT